MREFPSLGKFLRWLLMKPIGPGISPEEQARREQEDLERCKREGLPYTEVVCRIED